MINGKQELLSKIQHKSHENNDENNTNNSNEKSRPLKPNSRLVDMLNNNNSDIKKNDKLGYLDTNKFTSKFKKSLNNYIEEKKKVEAKIPDYKHKQDSKRSNKNSKLAKGYLNKR